MQIITILVAVMFIISAILGVIAETYSLYMKTLVYAPFQLLNIGHE